MIDYPSLERAYKARYAIRVRRWRRAMTGCAWQTRYQDGAIINWIEAPRPRSPISLAVFLHEVGHHVIGFDTLPTRCEEEWHAWNFALQQMRICNVPIDPRVQTRFTRSIRYAVAQALRRGLTTLPDPLRSYAPAA